MTEKKKKNSSDELIPGFKSVDEFSKEGCKRIIEATKSFQGLPQPGAAWELQKSYPEFSRAMKNCRSKIVPILSTLLRHSKVSPHDFKSRDLEEKFDFIVDTNDNILERVASALDEVSGAVKKAEAIVVNPLAAAMKPPGSWGKRKARNEKANEEISRFENGAPEIPVGLRLIKKAFHRSRVSEKPQLKFSEPIDNSLQPFVPKLLDKPNSLKPLSILPEYTTNNEMFYGHPYQFELDRWEPKDDILKKVVPKLPKKMLATPFNKIFHRKDVDKMIEHLRTVKDVAVDLEHHSFRSFLGLTCLMQISTREQDFVIDAFDLRNHLQALNEIFTNPKVVKVLHGASSDIEWLQRDLGLYMVGMFDTGVAAKQLGLPQTSLQFLLNHYCNLKVDKSLQLADWRIRPLPDEMLTYARQDTHNLLYIYDLMKNELIEAGNKDKNLLVSVFDQSRMICLKRYEKPGNNPQLSLRKTRRSLNNRQLYAYTEIFKWRDAIAREKDESLGYVLPNHMLFQICETLPKEMTGILACCDPVPFLVQTNLGTLHRIILIARDLPLREVTFFQDNKTEKKEKLKDWVVLMNSLHDVNLAELERGERNAETDDIVEVHKDNPFEVQVWPLEAKSADLTGVILRSKPSNKYISKIIGEGKHVRRRVSKNEGEKDPNVASPFERYQLSRKILDLLNDPEKRTEADLSNPAVKAVYDTLMYDPDRDERERRAKFLQPEAQLAKVLPDSEFVPFNPFATQSKNAKKKRKLEDEPPVTPPPQQEQDVIKPTKAQITEEFINMCTDDVIDVSSEDGECSDSDDTSGRPKSASSKTTKFISVPVEEKRVKNKKKKKKNNILNKIKFMAKKRTK